MPNPINQFPKTENELRKVIREEVRNELSITKIDLVDSFQGIATKLKSDILDSVDKVMGELEKSREEQTVQSGMLSDHSDRIEKLEHLHPEIQASI